MFKSRMNFVGSAVSLSKRALATQQNDVLFEVTNNVGIITLNRPKYHNALNFSMIMSMQKQLKDWENEKSLVIIKGNGGKSFCSGGDLVEIVAPNGADIVRNEYMLNYQIAKYKLPYVALLNGIVMGGGVGVSVHGKYRVATERTVAAMPEIKVGIMPDTGATYFLPRMPRKLGIFLGLTGYSLKGNDAVKAGIATHYVPSERLPELETLLTKCTCDPEIADVLRKFHEHSDEFTLTPYMDHIEECFSASSVEEIIQKLETVNNDWSRKLIQKFNESCPGALCITFRALQLGAKLDLADCLRMEFRVGYHNHRGQDGPEGVRAILIDKNRQPRWKHTRLADVDSTYVESFFRKIPGEDDLQLP